MTAPHGRSDAPSHPIEAPATEAGKQLLDDFMDIEGGSLPIDPGAVILAIEQQARDEGRREAVREIREQTYAAMKDMGFDSGKVVALFDHEFTRILDRVAGLNASESPRRVRQREFTALLQEMQCAKCDGPAHDGPCASESPSIFRDNPDVIVEELIAEQSATALDRVHAAAGDASESGQPPEGVSDE